MTARVTLAVFDRDDMVTPVAEPTTWWPEGNDVFLDELDDQGGLSFNVQADDPDIGSIEAGQILVVSLDATPIWRGVIRKRTTREVAATEADRYSTFVGTGEVGRLDEIVVYPTGGLGRFPFSDEVRFDWTHPLFPDSGWDTPVETPANYGLSTENFGLPEGFPYGTAEWIWDVDVSGGSIPAETKYFRKSGTTVSADGVFEAWSAADDINEVWIEGTSILKSSDAPYDGRTTAAELFITAGTICTAAKVENRNTLKAGFLYGVGKPLTAGDTPIVVTDDTWKIAPDGAELGMSAGRIMDILLDGATARGEDVPAITFSATLDSNGDAWDTFEQMVVPVGATYLDVLRQMVEMEMCDFRMSADDFELNLYNAGAAGSTVAYTLDDSNLTSLTWDTTPAVSTALLVRWERGYTDEENAGLVTTYGRRTALLSLGGVTSEATAEAQAAQVISRFGEDRTEIAASIEPEDTASEPYTLYFPGDSITVPGPGSSSYYGGEYGEYGYGEAPSYALSAQRVMAIGMGLDDTGNPTWDIHLNSHIEEMEKRQALMLKRLAGGSVGGRSQTTTIPYQPRPIQPRDPLEVDWSMVGTITTTVGAKKAFARAVRIREFRMELEGTITGTYTAELLENGSTVTGSSISMTAAGEKYVTLGEIVTQRPSGYIQPEITAVGSGATRITLTAVYA